MIYYDSGQYGLNLVFWLRGSVFPPAMRFALVPAVITITFGLLISSLDLPISFVQAKALSQFYNTFTWVLGSILVFRTSTAYGRYWDSANLLKEMRAEWYDACAQCMGFAETSIRPAGEVAAFQGGLVRLSSLLHCLALQQIAVMEDESFEIVDLTGFSKELLVTLQELDEPGEKLEVVYHWIQRLILEACNSGVVPTPAPIVSRTFQELNAGLVAFTRMLAITDTPFPFPYAQMIMVVLLIHSVLTPVVLGTLGEHFVMSGVFAFAVVCSLMALNLTANEIEHPFGDDSNDFDCAEAQRGMNRSLLLLLNPGTQALPTFTPATETKSMPSHRTGRITQFLPQDSEMSPAVRLDQIDGWAVSKNSKFTVNSARRKSRQTAQQRSTGSAGLRLQKSASGGMPSPMPGPAAQRGSSANLCHASSFHSEGAAKLDGSSGLPGSRALGESAPQQPALRAPPPPPAGAAPSPASGELSGQLGVTEGVQGPLTEAPQHQSSTPPAASQQNSSGRSSRMSVGELQQFRNHQWAPPPRVPEEAAQQHQGGAPAAPPQCCQCHTRVEEVSTTLQGMLSQLLQLVAEVGLAVRLLQQLLQLANTEVGLAVRLTQPLPQREGLPGPNGGLKGQNPRHDLSGHPGICLTPMRHPYQWPCATPDTH